VSVRYSVNDYRSFLKNLLNDRDLLQHQFAARMGRSPAWASQILTGRRGLRRKLAQEIVRVLELDEAEGWEFLRLVDEAVSPLPAQERSEAASRPTLERWYVRAIAELAGCDQYQPDPEWVAAALRPRIEAREALEAMRLLRDLGVLDARFQLARRGRRSGATPNDEEVQQVIELWSEALRLVPPNERRNHLGTVALSEEGHARLLDVLKRVVVELQAIEPAGVPNRVYQVILATFPVSLYSDSAAHPSEIED